LLKSEPSFQLENPSVSGERSNLYFPNPPALRDMLTPNLEKALAELIVNSETLMITDATLEGTSISVKITFSD